MRWGNLHEMNCEMNWGQACDFAIPVQEEFETQ